MLQILNLRFKMQKAITLFYSRILFFLMPFLVAAQELPPIGKYSPSVYGAGNQNWMIAQDQNRFVFFANNGCFRTKAV